MEFETVTFFSIIFFEVTKDRKSISHLDLLQSIQQLQWVVPGWMAAAHQSYSATALLSWAGERKCHKSLMTRDEDRDITH